MARKPGNTLQATAYHEAAHAVVARNQRLRVYSISIVQEGDSAGRVISSNPLWDTMLDIDNSTKARMKMERIVIQSLAGPIAEEKFCSDEVPDYHAAGDYSTCIELVSRFCSSTEEVEAYLNYLNIRAQNIVNDPFIWLQIDTLAKVLLDKKTLSNRKIAEILREC